MKTEILHFLSNFILSKFRIENHQHMNMLIQSSHLHIIFMVIVYFTSICMLQIIKMLSRTSNFPNSLVQTLIFPSSQTTLQHGYKKLLLDEVGSLSSFKCLQPVHEKMKVLYSGACTNCVGSIALSPLTGWILVSIGFCYHLMPKHKSSTQISHWHGSQHVCSNQSPAWHMYKINGYIQSIILELTEFFLT